MSFFRLFKIERWVPEPPREDGLAVVDREGTILLKLFLLNWGIPLIPYRRGKSWFYRLRLQLAQIWVLSNLYQWANSGSDLNDPLTRLMISRVERVIYDISFTWTLFGTVPPFNMETWQDAPLQYPVFVDDMFAWVVKLNDTSGRSEDYYSWIETWDERFGAMEDSVLFIDVVQMLPHDEKSKNAPVRIFKPTKLQAFRLDGETPLHHRLDTRGIKTRHESERAAQHHFGLAEAYEMFGMEKTWYVIVDQDVYPIIPSLMYILQRFDHTKPYFFSQPTAGSHGGGITILSLAAVDMILGKRSWFQDLLVERFGGREMPVSELPKTGEEILKAAARKVRITINEDISKYLSKQAPEFTRLDKHNHADLLLGFTNVTTTQRKQYNSTFYSEDGAPIFREEIWDRLHGIPQLYSDGYVPYGGDESQSGFWRSNWDYIGPVNHTASNVVEYINGSWTDDNGDCHHGENLHRYTDGSWTVTWEPWGRVSDECSEWCWHGGRECYAWTETFDLLGDRSGIPQCTFSPWMVVGRPKPVVGSVNMMRTIDGWEGRKVYTYFTYESLVKVTMARDMEEGKRHPYWEEGRAMMEKLWT